MALLGGVSEDVKTAGSTMDTTQIRMIKEVRTPIAKAIWNKPSIPQAAAKAAYLSHSLALRTTPSS